MKRFIYLFMKRAIVALSESTASKGKRCASKKPQNSFEVWVPHVTEQPNYWTENTSPVSGMWLSLMHLLNVLPRAGK